MIWIITVKKLRDQIRSTHHGKLYNEKSVTQPKANKNLNRSSVQSRYQSKEAKYCCKIISVPVLVKVKTVIYRLKQGIQTKMFVHVKSFALSFVVMR